MLPGVKVAVLNHPEFGQTRTRADGKFDLAVNGGGTLTFDYSKENFLPAQRTLSTPWRDYVIAPDVVLVPLDSQVTIIDLAAPVMQVARGSTSTDEDGTRRATLLFAPGTSANMVFADGTAQPLTAINVRATEYTIGPNGPQAMPAALPPASAYTYAVELSVDEAIAVGAKEVTFNQPVIQYVENFRNFPVGGIVPVGFYDRQKAAWIPSDNGKVIQILTTTGGIAELDTDGDGSADDPAQLAALNITDTERSQLASLYAPNTSLWRVPITHFTPWDYNWPTGPPPDAEPPQQPEPEKEDNPEPDPCKQAGSIIECQNQVLGEKIDVVGTPYALHYQSDRVPGRKVANILSISLSGASVPASLKRIELRINIAGQRFSQSFPAAPNQTFTFEWDGTDTYGRKIQGSQTATVLTGYVYDAVYQLPAQFIRSFSALSGIPINGSLARQEVTLWQENALAVGGLGFFDARALRLGGWTVSAHHFYDPVAHELFLGDGRRRAAANLSHVFRRAGGGGSNAALGGSAPAKQVNFGRVENVEVGPDGSIYFFSRNLRDFLQRIRPDGIAESIDVPGFPFDDVAIGPDGSVYFTVSNFVRRIALDGTVSIVAGGGSPPDFVGNGGLATEASLDSNPARIDVGPDGSLYITHFFLGVRRVTPDGIINSFAGSGNPADGLGDGGPATQARVDAADVALGPDGSIYIADRNRVRRVTPDGIITTVAGGGQPADGLGDGGPATQARLVGRMRHIAVAPDGGLYIVDSSGRLRYVSPEGIITTVAGGGTENRPFFLDGHLGTQVPLILFHGVAVDSEGRVFLVYHPTSGSVVNSQIVELSNMLPGFSPGEMVIASEDGFELYRFSSEGRHIETRDVVTGLVRHRFVYEANGLLSEVHDRDGNVTRLLRANNGELQQIVAPEGLTTDVALEANGYLSQLMHPDGNSASFSYTPDGLLTTFTDPRGNSSTMTYDASGRLLKNENAAGGSWTLSRLDEAGSFTTSLTSALGRTKTYNVENLPDGNKRWENVGADGTTTITAFNTDGSKTTTVPDGTITTVTQRLDPQFVTKPQLTTTTVTTPSGLTSVSQLDRSVSLADPDDLLSITGSLTSLVFNGKAWNNAYNASTKQFTLTTPTGRKTTSIIDDVGRVIFHQPFELAPVSLVYDLRGRPVTITQGSGFEQRVTTLGYNVEGFLDTLTDALNRTRRFTYDAAGRLTMQTLSDGREVRFTYDGNGNITSVTPPGRPTHNFRYTPVDLEEQYTPPALIGGPNPSTRFEYNLDKQVTKITRPDGQAVALAYDTAGRLASLAPSIAIGGATINYAYHPTKSFLESITTTDAESLTYTHDGFLLRGETWGGSIAGSVTRGYNSDFRVSGLSVNGTNIPFSYDNDGLLTQAGGLTLTRDPQHGLIAASALGSVSTTQAYNIFGELRQFTTSFGSTGSYDVQFTRDALGRITQKSETLPGELASTFTYGYDLAGRLTTVTKDGTTVAQYVYDSNGNRLSTTTPTGTITGTYDDQDRLLTYGDNTYTYTANGELRTKAISGQLSAISYGYDVFGNLRHVTRPDGASIDYVIDGRNRRIGKKVNGQLVQGFLYQDHVNPIAELDGQGNLTGRFVYGSRSNVPDYVIKNDQTYRFISDHLGSPRLIINTQTGVVEQRLDYDEFGNITFDSNPGFQPFGFAGGIYDQHTKFIRFGARDYDSEIGRWTAKDPIRFKGRSTNLYGYVLNDPVNWLDPGGYIQVKPGANIKNLSPEMRATFPVIDSFIQSNTAFSEGTITSGNDSKHKKGSFHYQDNAIDVRGNNVPDDVMSRIAEDIKWELGPDYDVIPEFYPDDPTNDHIHIEYDPKGPKGNCP